MTPVAFQLLYLDVRFKTFCLRCARGLKYFFIVKLSDRILIRFRFASGGFLLSRIYTQLNFKGVKK